MTSAKNKAKIDLKPFSGYRNKPCIWCKKRFYKEQLDGGYCSICKPVVEEAHKEIRENAKEYGLDKLMSL